MLLRQATHQRPCSLMYFTQKHAKIIFLHKIAPSQFLAAKSIRKYFLLRNSHGKYVNCGVQSLSAIWYLLSTILPNASDLSIRQKWKITQAELGALLSRIYKSTLEVLWTSIVKNPFRHSNQGDDLFFKNIGGRNSNRTWPEL